MRQAAEPLFDDCEPLAQIIGARIEACILVEQAALVALQMLDRLPILAFGRREQPAAVVEMEQRLRLGEVTVLD